MTRRFSKLVIDIAIGINLGLFVYALISSQLQLLALPVFNILLLTPACLMSKEKEEG